MAVIIGLMPALTLDERKDLSDFSLCPISELGQFACEETDVKEYRELASAYADRREASRDHQSVLIQRSGRQPEDVRITEARAAVDCFAFSAVCGGRKHMLQRPGWAVLAFPDYFHLSPIAVGRDGGFLSRTSRLSNYSSDTENVPLYWPVERPADSHGIRWDSNLLIALSDIVDRLLTKAEAASAQRITRSLSLMNQALRGFSDLIPGHVETTEPLVSAISALETLLHPDTGNVNRGLILHEVKMLSFADGSFPTELSGAARKKKIVALVDQAYEVRHAYSHGDDIESKQLCYNADQRMTDVLRPLLFLFRKLVVAKAQNMGCIGFDGPPDESTERLSIEGGVNWFSASFKARDLRHREKEYDCLIGRLLAEPRWWPTW